MFEFLGHKWGDSTFGEPSGTISWNANLNGLTPAGDATIDQLESALQSAFTAWENVANVDFIEVAGAADVNVGDVTFGPDSDVLAVARISDLSDFSEPNVADISFSAEVPWAPMTDPDVVSQNFFAVALHEIGHILGLEHVDDPTQIMNAFLTADDLGNGDIQGIQALYGTDESDVAVDIPQEDIDDAVARATAESGDGRGGDGDGGGGGGGIIALLLGLVGLALSGITGGAGGLAFVAATRSMDDGDDEATEEALSHWLFSDGAGHCGHSDCGEFCSHHDHDHEHGHAHFHEGTGHCGHADCGEICTHGNDEPDEPVLDETNFLPMIPVEEFAQTEDMSENEDELFLL